MRVERLDHVHVYVKSLTEAATFFSDLLGCKFVGPLEPPPGAPNGGCGREGDL